MSFLKQLIYEKFSVVINDKLGVKLDKNNPDSLPLSYIHPKDGRALRYHYDEFMIQWIPRLKDEIIKKNNLKEWRKYFGDDLLDTFIEQSLYLELLITSKALFRRKFYAEMKWQWNKPVYINPELAKAVFDTYPSIIKETIRESLTIKFKDHFKNFIKNLYLALLNSIFFLRNQQPQKLPNSKICIELAEGIDPSGKNDAFWMRNNGIDPKNVLFLIEPQNLISMDVKKTLDYAKKIGANLVSTNPFSAKKLNIPFWKPRVNLNKTYTVHLEDKKINKWLLFKLKKASKRIEYWKAFFSYYNIVVYQHFSELNIEGIIRRAAASSLSAIEVGRMRSQFFEKASPAYFFEHEVNFVWHRNVLKILNYSSRELKYLIEIGYPYDYICKDRVDFSSRAIASNFNNHISRICIVYDNHPSHDNHISLKQVNDFYTSIIDTLKKFSHIGIIIKSKKPHILKKLPGIYDELQNLVDLKSCMIISSSAASTAYYSLNSDIAIGMPCSTAVCESALLGCDVAMYDPSGASRTKDKSFKNITFNQINEFSAFLTTVLSSKIKNNFQNEFKREISKVFVRSASKNTEDFLLLYLKNHSYLLTKEQILNKVLVIFNKNHFTSKVIPNRI